MHEQADRSRHLDRELNELLQELRVIQGGILLLVGFELVVAFSARFNAVSTFERFVYFATLIVTGVAAIVVVAPVVHHRLAFRKRDKERIVVRGNRHILVAIVLVAFSILGITVLVTDIVYGFVVSMVTGGLYILLVGTLWGALPMHSIRAASREAGHSDLT